METWSSYIDGLGREGCAADPAALLRPGLELELIRQPADMGRPFAVAVHRRGVLIGYLPKPDARPVSKLLDRNGRARAFVLALRHERSLTGAKLKSITIEIEAANPDDAPWSDADRAEIAALGVDAPLVARKRSYAMPGRIAGALCVAVVAVTAWANISDLTPDLDGPESTAMMSAMGTDEDDGASKAQERLAGAGIAAASLSLPMIPNAALALPTRFTPFADQGATSQHVVVAVRNAADPTPVASAPAPTAAAAVPMPLPRPEKKSGRNKR